MSKPPPANSPETTESARRVEERLEARYGPAAKARLEPLEELILTILSQSTTDVNRDRAWDDLRKRYESWSDLAASDAATLESTIRVAGLAAQKSATIMRVLETLRDGSTWDLSHLAAMEDDEALKSLTGIKGVGTKTAACVLCFSLRRPVIPVDTHVHRVTQRLGLVPRGATPQHAHDILNETVPPDLRFSLHIHLVEHGRQTCTGRSAPACDACVLSDLCPKVGVEEPMKS